MRNLISIKSDNYESCAQKNSKLESEVNELFFSEMGFSLIETLISALLLVIITIGLISTMTASIEMQKRSTEMATLNDIGIQIIEDLRDISFQQLPIVSDVTLDDYQISSRLGNSQVENLYDELYKLEARESITIENFGDSKLMRISVSVEYINQNKKDYYPVHLATFVAKNGINQ